MQESPPATPPQRTIKPGRWIFRVALAVFLISLGVFGVRIYRHYTAIKTVERYGGVVQRLDQTWMSSISETPFPFIESDLIVYFDGSPIDDQSLKNLIPHLEHLHQMKWLKLENCKITDSTISRLAVFDQLRGLNLTGTEVSDAGIGNLVPLQNLEVLALADTNLTDRGISSLKKIKNLKQLYLDHNELSDDSIVELKVLKNLKHLSLSNTGVTDSECAELVKAIPGLEILDD